MQYFPEDFYSLKNRAIYATSIILSDLVLFIAGSVLAYYLRFFTILFGENKATYTINMYYVYYSIAFVVITVIIIDILRSYNIKSIYTGFDYYLKIELSLVLSIIILVAFSYFVQGILLSRGWILLLFAINSLFILSSRMVEGLIVKRWVHYYGIPLEKVAVGFVECLRAMQRLQE